MSRDPEAMLALGLSQLITIKMKAFTTILFVLITEPRSRGIALSPSLCVCVHV